MEPISIQYFVVVYKSTNLHMYYVNNNAFNNFGTNRNNTVRSQNNNSNNNKILTKNSEWHMCETIICLGRGRRPKNNKTPNKYWPHYFFFFEIKTVAI